MICYLDLETRSAADLRKTGAYRYFEDDTADVLCAAYALGDGEVQTWVRGDPAPEAFNEHVRNGGVVSAHNAQFEYWALLVILGPRYGWEVPAIEQLSDTMAFAAAMSIPQSLDGASKALGLDEKKDDAGKRLIRKFSVPRRARKGEVPGKLYWNEPADHPAEFQSFVDYCVQDVVVERAVKARLVPLSDYEQKVWEFNLRMNTRGVAVDLDLVRALLRITDAAKAKLDAEMARATDWEITACSQVSALTAWLRDQGVDADKLNKNSIEEILEQDLPERARRAVELRKEAAKTSTAKLSAMATAASKDGRVRGVHAYHGASTGRWAGRLVQCQNMPRGTGTIKNPEAAVPHLLKGDADLVELLYGSPMSAASDCLRACLVASPDHRLLAADYSSIEGRVTAWVAGEQWKIDAFIANDRKEGPGMYELAASGIFAVPVESIGKKSQERQVGKAAELGLGFGGGVMAFHAMASVYGVTMDAAYEPLRGSTAPETWERAIERYEECCERGDTGTDLMTREAWIASEVTKVNWRAKHPATKALWRGLEDAAIEAVRNPGTVVTYGKVAYLVRKGFLWCRLPSGRCLAYGNPVIKDRKTPWGAMKPAVTALGVNSVTKRWERSDLYGGLLTENVVQAIARDLMANGMLKAEAAGYPIVLTIHDEAVADVPNGHGDLAEFENLLCDLPGWAEGLPVVAEGYSAQRYKKD